MVSGFGCCTLSKSEPYYFRRDVLRACWAGLIFWLLLAR